MTNRRLVLVIIFMAPSGVTLRYLPRFLLPRIATNSVDRRPRYLRSMSSYPAKIKAIQVTAHGGPEVLAVGPGCYSFLWCLLTIVFHCLVERNSFPNPPTRRNSPQSRMGRDKLH